MIKNFSASATTTTNQKLLLQQNKFKNVPYL